MFKQLTLFLFLIALSSYRNNLHAQGGYICGFSSDINGLSTTTSTIKNPNLDALMKKYYLEIWRDQIGGDPSTIELSEKSLGNLDLKYAASGKELGLNGAYTRYLYYDPTTLTEAITKTNDGWLLKSIIAHELGHHLNGNAFLLTHVYVAETSADEFSGFCLAKAKVELDVATAAVSKLTKENNTNGYPPRSERIKSVTAGWNRGILNAEKNSIIYKLTYKPTKEVSGIINLPVMIRQQDYFEKGLEKDAYIEKNSGKQKQKIRINNVYNKSFDGFAMDEDNLFYWDGKSYLTVGSVSESNRPEYKKMVIDKYYRMMYINDKNQLVVFKTDKESPNGRYEIIGAIK